MPTFTITSITPDDLLDAAATIPLGRFVTCDWLDHWIPAFIFLDWGLRGLEEGDDNGLTNAVSHAKRAVGCRIDMLLQYNHMTPFIHDNYPEKINALREIGVKIPNVVHELVISPRNELEHMYEQPSNDSAKHAVGIAELFLHATEPERKVNSIIATGWNVLSNHVNDSKRQYIEFIGFRKDTTMLFVDVFENHRKVKVIDAENQEIRSIRLDSFSRPQSTKLAQLLRKNRSYARIDAIDYPLNTCAEIKQQARI